MKSNGSTAKQIIGAIAPPLGGPIESRYVADDVVDRLVTALGLGVYVDGQQLPTERELAAMLGVSRTSVRDALKQLTDRGYLEVRRGRNGGYFVLVDWGPDSAASCAPPARRALERVRTHFRCAQAGRADDCPHGSRKAHEGRHRRNAGSGSGLYRCCRTATSRGLPTRRCTLLSRRQRTIRSWWACPKTCAPRSRSTSAPNPTPPKRGRTAIVQHAELVAAVVDGRGDDAAEIAARTLRDLRKR